MAWPGYSAGYGSSSIGQSASGVDAAPSDAPYLVNGSTDQADLSAEVLIGALTSGLTWAIEDAVTNSATDLHTFRHTSTGTTAAGFGIDLGFELEDDGGNTVEAGTIRCFLQDALSTSTDSAFSIYVLRNDSLFEVARFTGGAVTGNEALLLGQNGGTVTIASLDDVDTGVFWLGADQLSLLSGGVASITINTLGAVIVNNSSGSAIDFRVNGDTVTNLLFCDVSADKIAVAGTPPSDAQFTVFGDQTAENTIRAQVDTTQTTLITDYSVLSLRNINTTTNNFCGIGFHTLDSNSAAVTGAEIWGVFTDHTASSVKGELVFGTTFNNTLAERVRISAGTTTGGGWIIMDEADSSPGTGNLDANDSIGFYNKANTLVFAYNNSGTITYVKLALDGAATTWVHDTTAP